MDERKIKIAFQKIKEEIDFLKRNIEFIKTELSKTTKYLENLSTHKDKIQAHSTIPSTHKEVFKSLKPQNSRISIGNRGASTDRQTDRQTDVSTQKTPENTFEDASELLESLDTIKRELRIKFKRLTEQELLVFSRLYQLDEEKGFTDYKTLSEDLNLTESSIRDYIGRLIKKGIPVDKKRVNNKNIHLSISANLKKIASLSTILQLRSL